MSQISAVSPNATNSGHDAWHESAWYPDEAPPTMAAKLLEVDHRMQHAHAHHLGYPYNLVGRSPVPAALGNYLVNNLGDPYIGSHYGSEVCDLERDAVACLMRLWNCDPVDQYWGSIGASGTEGNFWGLYLGREAFPDAVMLYSADAHYSLPKSGRILRIESRMVASHANGEFDLDALSESLAELQGRPVILALTCGTTVKGAHDDIGGAIARLDQAGYGPERRYIHVDGALNAMVLPFIPTAPFTIQPNFRHAIDSLSTSGHKMIGTPMPCGVLVAKRAAVERVASAVAYLRSHDTTLMGSRNGHAVLAIWARLFGHGLNGYRQDVATCLDRAGYLTSTLSAAGVPVLRNPYSLTVVFPQPAEALVRLYQLACHHGQAHAIVMPNVSQSLLDEFLAGYLAWWRASGARQRAAG